MISNILEYFYRNIFQLHYNRRISEERYPLVIGFMILIRQSISKLAILIATYPALFEYRAICFDGHRIHTLPVVSVLTYFQQLIYVTLQHILMLRKVMEKYS